MTKNQKILTTFIIWAILPFLGCFIMKCNPLSPDVLRQIIAYYSGSILIFIVGAGAWYVHNEG